MHAGDLVDAGADARSKQSLLGVGCCCGVGSPRTTTSGRRMGFDADLQTDTLMTIFMSCNMTTLIYIYPAFTIHNITTTNASYLSNDTN